MYFRRFWSFFVVILFFTNNSFILSMDDSNNQVGSQELVKEQSEPKSKIDRAKEFLGKNYKKIALATIIGSAILIFGIHKLLRSDNKEQVNPQKQVSPINSIDKNKLIKSTMLSKLSDIESYIEEDITMKNKSGEAQYQIYSIDITKPSIKVGLDEDIEINKIAYIAKKAGLDSKNFPEDYLDEKIQLIEDLIKNPNRVKEEEEAIKSGKKSADLINMSIINDVKKANKLGEK